MSLSYVENVKETSKKTYIVLATNYKKIAKNNYPTLNCQPVCSNTQPKNKPSISLVADVDQSKVTSLSSTEIETRYFPDTPLVRISLDAWKTITLFFLKDGSLVVMQVPLTKMIPLLFITVVFGDSLNCLSFPVTCLFSPHINPIPSFALISPLSST